MRRRSPSEAVHATVRLVREHSPPLWCNSKIRRELRNYATAAKKKNICHWVVL